MHVSDQMDFDAAGKVEASVDLGIDDGGFFDSDHLGHLNFSSPLPFNRSASRKRVRILVRTGFSTANFARLSNLRVRSSAPSAMRLVRCWSSDESYKNITRSPIWRDHNAIGRSSWRSLGSFSPAMAFLKTCTLRRRIAAVPRPRQESGCSG